MSVDLTRDRESWPLRKPLKMRLIKEGSKRTMKLDSKTTEKDLKYKKYRCAKGDIIYFVGTSVTSSTDLPTIDELRVISSEAKRLRKGWVVRNDPFLQNLVITTTEDQNAIYEFIDYDQLRPHDWVPFTVKEEAVSPVMKTKKRKMTEFDDERTTEEIQEPALTTKMVDNLLQLADGQEEKSVLSIAPCVNGLLTAGNSVSAQINMQQMVCKVIRIYFDTRKRKPIAEIENLDTSDEIAYLVPAATLNLLEENYYKNDVLPNDHEPLNVLDEAFRHISAVKRAIGSSTMRSNGWCTYDICPSTTISRQLFGLLDCNVVSTIDFFVNLVNSILIFVQSFIVCYR